MNPDPLKESYRAGAAANRWPYPSHVYIVRIFWSMTWNTIWKLATRRLPLLRTMLLRFFGARVKFCSISGSAWVEMPWDLEIGDHVLIGPRVHLYNLGGLSIGDHTVLSQDVYVCGGTHDYTDPGYPLIRKKITIGSYVWIAAGAFIHPGVTIGEGAVVGARAVVTQDVAPWTIVAGNPAKFIKQRVIQTAAQTQELPQAGAEAAPPSI